MLYFFRFGLLTFFAACAGGGVVAKRFTACSNVIPFTRKSIAFGIMKASHSIKAISMIL
jgi:hypothetical protein